VNRPVIQLPAEPWRQQPKIATASGGAITNRISIVKTGKNCVHRVLRVEGLDAQGRTGYYEKDIQESDPSAWLFHVTREELRGRPLENKPYDSTAETLGPSEDRSYVMGVETPASPQGLLFTAEVPDFNCYNSPARLIIRLADGSQFGLLLHYLDTVRIFPRERGLDQNPRRFSGAIEIPPDLYERLPALPPDVQEFVRTCLEIDDGGRFTDVRLYGTLDELRIQGGTFSWTFHRRMPSSSNP